MRGLCFLLVDQLAVEDLDYVVGGFACIVGGEIEVEGDAYINYIGIEGILSFPAYEVALGQSLLLGLEQAGLVGDVLSGDAGDD